MSNVAIVGAGDIGGATAHALAMTDRAGRLLLVDAAASAAQGKALDIRQAGAISGFHTRLEGTDDLGRLTGCDVCVIADRFGASAGEWRGDEGLATLNRMLPYLGSAPVVFAGALQADLIARTAIEAGIDRRRLIGSATEALASSVTAIVAMEAGCSPREVMLTVLGAPPSGFVVPWSEAAIGGYALQTVLSQVALTRIQARVPHLWPPGPYALGAAASRIVEALLTSSRQSFSVLTQLGGEFGVRNRPGGVWARLAARGIVQTVVPELTPRERVQLQSALGGPG
ncbi:MAG: lactate/malate family dehydrogenase [Vicinamibacterales bacterium]